MQDYTNEELIFGLDIGTRTIIGVVGYKANNQFVVLAYESVEHEERAMLDGQIHDIQKVCKTVSKVKNTLEKRLSVELTEVAVAAAGRALNTQIVSVESSYNEIQEFNITDVHNLELYGVEKAKQEQQKLNSQTEYFCVAYSIINYYLDGYVITNLEGHKGTTMGAKVLATFLPKLVIDSLYAVTERCGLMVVNLTLEPIAAINAVIPENLRLLNLALVDIGAGTSDIAITRGGSIVAYGMIPIAGDEVTEAIVHHYLVDFNTAEKIKQQITQTEVIHFEDILGFPQQVSVEEIQQVISPTIEILTKSIAEKILELNGDNATNAVFCVGGGSQMFSVEKSLAKLLKLSEQRVAIRSVDSVTQIVDEATMCNSPDLITPLGICITSMQNKYSQFTTVVLNDTKIQLLNAKKLTVLDAIVAAGLEHTSIFPQKGSTLMFKLNGERVRIKGEKGMPSQIMLNDQKANINDLIYDQDQVKVEMATQGKNGEAYIKEYIDHTLTFYMDDEKFTLPIIMVNGDCVTQDYKILQNDKIETIYPHTLKELFNALHIDKHNKIVTVNLTEVDEETYKIKDMDSILINEISLEVFPEDYSQVEEEVAEPLSESLFITVNGSVVALPKKETPYMFANIFDYIEFDLTKPQGTIQLIRNGAGAALTDNLCDRDQLDIFWKK